MAVRQKGLRKLLEDFIRVNFNKNFLRSRAQGKDRSIVWERRQNYYNFLGRQYSHALLERKKVNP